MNPSPVITDTPSIVDHAVVEGNPEGLEQFIAGVLRRAHQTAEARNAAIEARAILGVALLFADELTARHPGFDRVGFVAAATEDPS